MFSNKSTTVTVVNELIETCNERKAGYRKAIEHVRDFQHRNLFNLYAEQSARFAAELIPFSDEVSATEIGKGPLSAIFRGWADIKGALTRDDADAILQWCISGEEAAIQVYETAFKADLPKAAQQIASKHYLEFKEAIEQLNGLKKAG